LGRKVFKHLGCPTIGAGIPLVSHKTKGSIIITASLPFLRKTNKLDI